MPQVRVLLGAPLQEVGARGFEPPTSCAQGRRATRLRYAPLKSGGEVHGFRGWIKPFTRSRLGPAAPATASASARHGRDGKGDFSLPTRAPPASFPGSRRGGT